MKLEAPLAAAGGPRLLHPGDVACAGAGEILETLLGSCVAIILTDPRRTVGAMCHVVHTGCGNTASGRDTSFGEVALARMREMLLAQGIQPQLCHAYVYGGGNMFPQLVAPPHVGEDNARWARAALAREGIAIMAQDLGGAVYRRVSWTVGPSQPTVRAVPVLPVADAR